jgi:hypothetical protein
MKIAGRKNDGAWFRTNKLIKTLNSSQQDDLAQQLLDLSEFNALYTIVSDFQTAAGITTGESGYVDSAEELAATYAQSGIPRQAWFGRLSYDLYTRSGGPGSYEYTPTHQGDMHQAGKAIRKLMKEYIMARRQALDLGNVVFRTDGNPSGIADATEGT